MTNLEFKQIDIAQALSKLDPIDHNQVAIWRKMTPARRLNIAFQMHQFALNAIRVTVRRKHPELTADEFNWHVTRRMHGNLKLGREQQTTGTAK